LEGVILKELKIYEDERGWLGEIIRHDETDFRPVMSYISLTKPGQTRGPHEHQQQTDYFCFVGKFRLYLWDNRKDSSTYGKHMKIDINERPYIAVIPPGVVHAYKNTGNNNGYVINLPDRLYAGWGKKEPVDEIRYENVADSPFRIND